MTTTKLIPSHLTKPHADANNYFLFNSRKKRKQNDDTYDIYTPRYVVFFYIYKCFNIFIRYIYTQTFCTLADFINE